MDTAPFEPGSPRALYVKVMAAAYRLMSERNCARIPAEDVVAEIPGLDIKTMSTLLAWHQSVPSVVYPNMHDLNDAIVQTIFLPNFDPLD